MNRDLIVWLQAPSFMYLGDLKELQHLEKWNEEDLESHILPDMLFDLDSRQSVGIILPLDWRRLRKRAGRLMDWWRSDIVSLGRLPAEFWDDFGTRDFLSVQWASCSSLRGMVAQLGEAVWYSLPESGFRWRRKSGLVVAFAIYGFDEALEANELKAPESLQIPLVSADDWNRSVSKRILRLRRDRA